MHRQQLKGSAWCSGLLPGSAATSGYLPCHSMSTDLFIGMQRRVIVPRWGTQTCLASKIFTMMVISDTVQRERAWTCQPGCKNLHKAAEPARSPSPLGWEGLTGLGAFPALSSVLHGVIYCVSKSSKQRLAPSASACLLQGDVCKCCSGTSPFIFF